MAVSGISFLFITFIVIYAKSLSLTEILPFPLLAVPESYRSTVLSSESSAMAMDEHLSEESEGSRKHPRFPEEVSHTAEQDQVGTSVSSSISKVTRDAESWELRRLPKQSATQPSRDTSHETSRELPIPGLHSRLWLRFDLQLLALSQNSSSQGIHNPHRETAHSGNSQRSDKRRPPQFRV